MIRLYFTIQQCLKYTTHTVVVGVWIEHSSHVTIKPRSSLVLKQQYKMQHTLPQKLSSSSTQFQVDHIPQLDTVKLTALRDRDKNYNKKNYKNSL